MTAIRLFFNLKTESIRKKNDVIYCTFFAKKLSGSEMQVKIQFIQKSSRGCC